MASKIREIVVSKDVSFTVIIGIMKNIVSSVNYQYFSGNVKLKSEDGINYELSTKFGDHRSYIKNYRFNSVNNAQNYLLTYYNSLPNNYTSTQYLTSDSLSIARNWHEVTLPSGSYTIYGEYKRSTSYDAYWEKIDDVPEISNDKSGKKLLIYTYSSNGTGWSYDCAWL